MSHVVQQPSPGLHTQTRVGISEGDGLPRGRGRDSPRARLPPRFWLTLAGGTAALLGFRAFEASTPPWSIGDGVERVTNWAMGNLGPLFDVVASATETLLSFVSWILSSVPGGVLGFLLIAAAWTLVGPRFAAFVGIGLIGTWMLGLWSVTLDTAALMMTAALVASVLGVLIGILVSRSMFWYGATHSLLNAMQGIPVFVYLIPVMFIFGAGPVPATIVIALYACPPVIRLTALGLRQTPRASVEAAEAFGASEWQVLTKARLPQAMPSILLGFNQAIMLAMSMAIIAAMIGAPGLGRPVWLGVKNLQFGTALEAGIVVVFIAVVLDRLTRNLPAFVGGLRSRLARSTASSGAGTTQGLVARMTPSTRRRILGVGAVTAVAAIVAWRLRGNGTFDDLEGALQGQSAVDRSITWLNQTFGEALTALGDAFLLNVLLPTVSAVLGVSWWIIGGLLVAMALAIGSTRSGVVVAVSLLVIAWMDLWEQSIYTGVLALAAVAFCILIGVPIALAMSMSRRASSIFMPILDLMQTLPVFLYVIPAVILLGIGMVGALLATVVYCLPVIVRFTKLGLERDGVGPSEVASVFGASRSQALFKVRIPMALPHLILGVNQALIFALLMTVVGAFIGAPGLGEEVLLAIAKVDLSLGFEAGLAVLLLVIVTQRLATDLAQFTFHGAAPRDGRA